MKITTHQSDTLVEHARKLARESKHLIARYRAALPGLQKMVEETRQQRDEAKARLRNGQRVIG